MKPFFTLKQVLTLFLALFFFSVSLTAQAFTNLEGNPDSISNYIGKDKWTIVEIWESNCHACRKHMPDMVKFDGKLKNARILGVSLDTQEGIENAKAFIDEYKIKFPTLISNYVEMNIWMQRSLDEPLMGTPTFILFDDKGALVAAQPGIVSIDSLEKFIKLNSGQSKMQVVQTESNTTANAKTKEEVSKAPVGLPAEESED